MPKAKPGQRVRHTQSGKEGVIISVVRGTIRVLHKGGSTSTGYAGSYHKVGGCMAMPFLVIMGALGGSAAYIINQIYL